MLERKLNWIEYWDGSATILGKISKNILSEAKLEKRHK